MGEALVRLRRVCFVCSLVLASGCGTVDPGEVTLATPQRLPNAVLFGSRVHPLLPRQAGCAATECHASSSLFPLHEAEPLATTSSIEHPLDLPDPLLSDYFTVLSRVNMDNPMASPLFRWAQGDEPSHPGGDALNAEALQTILDWIHGAGP